MMSRYRSRKFFWIFQVSSLWCLVLLYISDCAYGCDSDGPIKQFPHCIGYWPPEYSPNSLKPIDYFNYTPAMSTNVEDLKTSTIAQERTIQVSILLPNSFVPKDIEEIIIKSEEKETNLNTGLNRYVGLDHLATAQKRSGMGLLVGFQTIRDKNLIRDDIFFNITLRDSKCHPMYGQKTFLDAFAEKVHVLFGPACDFTLGKPICKTIVRFIKYTIYIFENKRQFE